jgi:hypothetical protein
MRMDMILRHRLISSVSMDKPSSSPMPIVSMLARIVQVWIRCRCSCAAYDTGCTGYDILTDVEDRHHDVKGIGHEVDRHSRLEEPLEEHPCVHVVQVVFLGDHGDQLVTQDKGDDDTSDGDYHIFG